MDALKNIPNTTYLINKDAEVFNKFLKPMKVRQDGQIGIANNDGKRIWINPLGVRYDLFLKNIL